MIVSIFVQWGSLLCLSVIDVIQTYQQTLLFYVDQHHQQTNTIGVSESGFMLAASLEPVFVPFIHLRWCFHQRYRFSILDIFKLQQINSHHYCWASIANTSHLFFLNHFYYICYASIIDMHQ